jgi:hypothetical protein
MKLSDSELGYFWEDELCSFSVIHFNRKKNVQPLTYIKVWFCKPLGKLNLTYTGNYCMDVFQYIYIYIQCVRS